MNSSENLLINGSTRSVVVVNEASLPKTKRKCDKLAEKKEKADKQHKKLEVQSSNNRSPQQKNMVTQCSYACLDWRDTEFINDAPELSRKDTLEVPRWTVKEIVNCYSIEGTEDLTDETFLKRHSKLEVDERRRKRWDIQRLRENRVIERLRKRYMKDQLEKESKESKKGKVKLNSFFPKPDAAKFIQVQDDIPVVAFGETIPDLPPKVFDLPWRKQEKFDMSPGTSLTKTRLFLKS